MKVNAGSRIDITTFADGSIPPAASILTLSAHGIKCLAMFCAGNILSVFAYGSINPVAVAFVFILLPLILMRLFKLADAQERRAFVFVFSLTWMWAGVSAIYANHFDDPSQNNLDAAYFFDIVTKGDASEMGVMELILLHENGGAMAIWRYIYDIFHFFGFEKERFVGIGVNVALVSATSVLGIKMVKATFGQDGPRLERFTRIFALCGLYWMFAAIHLRDAAVLFSVTFLMLYWVAYLASPGFGPLLRLLAASGVSFLILGLLRREFIFVPVVMLGAGLTALCLGAQSRVQRNRVILGTLLIGLPLAAFLYSKLGSDIVSALLHNQETYNDLTAAESGEGSLGNSLIMNQAFPLRLTLGFVYLLVYPVPVWVGLQEGTAYHLFKSLHALFMYGLLPLLALSAWRVFRNRKAYGAPVFFLFFIVIGFAMSISYTSLENRHFGTFMVAMFVLAVLPDLSERAERRAYYSILKVFLAQVVVVHLAWSVLKVMA